MQSQIALLICDFDLRISQTIFLPGKNCGGSRRGRASKNSPGLGPIGVLDLTLLSLVAIGPFFFCVFLVAYLGGARRHKSERAGTRGAIEQHLTKSSVPEISCSALVRVCYGFISVIAAHSGHGVTPRSSKPPRETPAPAASTAPCRICFACNVCRRSARNSSALDQADSPAKSVRASAQREHRCRKSCSSLQR